MFEVFESNQYSSHVVQGTPQQTILNEVIYAKTWQLVDCRSLWIILLHIVYSIPYDLDAFSVRDSIVNAIAAKYDEIMLILNLESFDLRSSYEYTSFPTELFKLCFYVTEWPADW